MRIGTAYKPFIVAEMSGNHNQSLKYAIEIVEAAAAAGADALKIQTYTADTMTLDLGKGDFFIKDNKSPWKNNSLYALYKKAYTPWEWHEAIFKKCKKLGIIGFSTPFDFSAVDFLEKLNVPLYKIASFENTHLPLLKKIAKTKKPVIMSTGMATLGELEESVKVLKENGCKELVLLKCTSSYPADSKDSNIKTIPVLRELFNCEVGLSDHTLGVGVALASIPLGATLIEKHLTIKRSDGGIDSAFSLEPPELKMLVLESEKAWESLGKVKYGPTEKEKSSLAFKRSLYIAKDMKVGEILNSNNLRIVRPGFGLAPKYYESLLGRKIPVNTKKGTPVTWDLILGKKNEK